MFGQECGHDETRVAGRISHFASYALDVRGVAHGIWRFGPVVLRRCELGRDKPDRAAGVAVLFRVQGPSKRALRCALCHVEPAARPEGRSANRPLACAAATFDDFEGRSGRRVAVFKLGDICLEPAHFLLGAA